MAGSTTRRTGACSIRRTTVRCCRCRATSCSRATLLPCSRSTDAVRSVRLAAGQCRGRSRWLMEHIGGTSSSRLRDASGPRLTSERGFTLIETIVAALILTTALVALAQLLAVSVRMHKLGRDSAQATRLAQDKFEELMKLNFATAPALSTVSCANSLGANTANCFDAPANTGFT